MSGASGARQQGSRAASSPALGWLARAGLAARGVVYAVIGVLALEVALGQGGKATDQQGALRTIAQGPFGKFLLVVLAIGLAGYAAWRLLRAGVGHGAEQHDDTPDRVAAAASGISYAILCFTAIEILAGSGGGSGSPKKTTGGVLDWSIGPALVVIAGLVLIGVAGYQAYKGLGRKFCEDSKTEEMGPSTQRAFTALGVAGHVARAVVFALVGYGLIHAALTYDPQKAVGLDGALRQLADASYGPVLLGVVAAGLVCFAAYSIADARYRRV
ncbi:MAG TPA: DUF1206 domain-containing protein [Baekduia sp.]|nr:DUF1206 domain-containing protein [Baekduia sp.]